MKTKDQKRQEATARAAERAKRTNEDQIKRLDLFGFAATKERKKLAVKK